MPVMDGFEATRRIRQINKLKDVVIIAVSASAFEQTRQESLATGCQDFLTKPVTAQNLFDKLQVHLHIEWIYSDVVDGCHFESGAYLAEEPIIPPPPEELARLHDLALIGDIMGIRARIENIAALDPQFRPFAANVRTLAKALKVSEIQRFIKQYLS